MNEETFLSKISQLENEIEYLHGLLDNAVFFPLPLRSSIFSITIICLRVEMMCIVSALERLTRKPESMDIIRNAGISGKMGYVLRRIILSLIAENVRIRSIKN